MTSKLEDLAKLDAILKELEIVSRMESKEGSEHLVLNTRSNHFLLQIRLTVRGDIEFYGIVQTPLKIPVEKFSLAYEAINTVNTDILLGSFFLVAPKREVFFKVCVPLSTELDKDIVHFLVTRIVTTIDEKVPELISKLLLDPKPTVENFYSESPQHVDWATTRPKGTTLH